MRISDRLESRGASTKSVKIPLFCVDDNKAGGLAECAVPFPQGLIRDIGSLSLCGGGSPWNCDFRPMSHWPDGSLKWVRLVWVSSIDNDDLRVVVERDVERTVQEDERGRTRVHYPTAVVAPQSFGHELRVSGVEVSWAVALEDRTLLMPQPGAASKVLLSESADRDARPGHTRGAGTEAGNSPAEGCPVETLWDGGVTSHSVVRGTLVDPSAIDRLHWAVQIETHDEAKLQRWRVTVRNPRGAAHPGGIWELGDDNSILIDSLRLTIRPAGLSKDGAHQAHGRFASDHEWDSCYEKWELAQLGSGGAHYESPVHRDRTGRVHAPLQGYRLVDDHGQRQGKRATPSLVTEAANGSSVGAYVPRFWQTFPKGLKWNGDGISLDIFPAEFGCPTELQPGEQTTVVFWVATGTVDEVKSRLDAVANQPTVRVDPGWVARSGVVTWLSPGDDTDSGVYASLVDQAVAGKDTFFDKRDRIDEYGWRHFGDIYGDHESVDASAEHPLVSHYNNQYDLVFGFGVQYLRGGDAKFLELMMDLARHVIDIDLYHTDDDRACYNHGMFWHTTHYVDAGLSTHRSYPCGTSGGGPSSGHAYSRGLYLYYCLSGDETAREAVVKMGDWMIASEEGRQTKYRWFAGGETGLTTASGTEDYHGPGRGPGNAVDVLLTAFELTHERRFLDHAEHLIRRVIHPQQDIDLLDLLDAENRWFYLVFLQTLGRYLEVKISLGEIDAMYAYGKVALLRFADWMVEHERPFLDDPENLEYPTETWAAQDIRKTEVFQWAARHADQERRERFLERGAWFFANSMTTLSRFETKSLCRPVTLLLTNGYSHEFFRRGGLNGDPESTTAPFVTFPERQEFVSQKTRAIRNAKRAVALGVAVVAVGLLGLVVVLSTS